MEREVEKLILGGENFRNTQTFGFRDIVLRQVQKITNIYSQELTKGYWKKSQMGNYGQQEIVAYIPDGRLSYIQAVECLHDLLLPKFDKEMKQASKDIDKEIEDKNKEFLEKGERDWLKRKVKILRGLFQHLSLFLERLGWLETEGLED